MLARQYVPLELEDEDLRTILLNAHINDHFLSLGREVRLFIIVKENCFSTYVYQQTTIDNSF